MALNRCAIAYIHSLFKLNQSDPKPLTHYRIVLFIGRWLKARSRESQLRK